jgi:hypothetical protein
MSFVDQPFADTFDFARARVAALRGPDGLPATAAIDAPRFDHDAEGSPRGLLVEGRPEFGAADRLTVKAGAWETARGTVLHEYEAPDGEVRRRAWYARTDPRAIVDACLGVKGRHRLVAYVPGHLKNRGGEVRWRDRLWALGAMILVDAGELLAPVDDTPFIEG